MILTSGMAAWTQDDADAVRAAIRDLAVGKRVVTVNYAGPPQRSVEYAAVDIDRLQALLAEIERAVGDKPRFRLASTRTGL